MEEELAEAEAKNRLYELLAERTRCCKGSNKWGTPACRAQLLAPLLRHCLACTAFPCHTALRAYPYLRSP